MHWCTPNGPWLRAWCTQAARTAPRPRAHCIVSWPSTGRVAACGRYCHRRAVPCRLPAKPYRSTSPAVSQHCIATCPVAKPLPPCHDTIDCIVTRLQPDCPLVTIQRLYRDTTPQRPAHCLRHDTILCIATQSTSQAARALPAVSCPLSAVSWPLLWPYCRPCWASTRPCRGP